VTQRYGVPAVALAAVLLTNSLWARWLAMHAVLHAAYVLYVGGDFYPGHRFLLVLTPNLALLGGILLEKGFALSRGGLVKPAALAAAVLVCGAVRWGTLRQGTFVHNLLGSATTVDNNVQYMRWLKDVARPGASLVVGDIGATGLFADVRVIDYFGVVDPAVARKHVPNFGTGNPGHEKVLSREEQLARRPTYIKWGYVDDWRRPPGYYIFSDFPRHLRVEGLWVLDDRGTGEVLTGAGFDFGREELAGWTGSGTVFPAQPAHGPNSGQTYVNGQFGPFVNTFVPGLGDRATGTLVSPHFQLRGDRMRLLVGGGSDPERLRVSLLVDGRREFSATGTNWETLGRREWNIAPLRGKLGQIEIVDHAEGAWGHILVDEIEQWTGAPSASGKL
ncbi:MAG TPA: hypothetical protein VIM73_00925, partial [Polyangiaceae bacterium]